jgi:hypothetical protein
MCYPHESSPADEVSENVTVNQTQIRRKRGGQRGNPNACKHGFYSAALSPVETRELWTITNQEGVDPELALIRVKLQSSLERDPGNRRVVREASRLLVKWYSENYGLDSIERNYLKAVVDNFLEIAYAGRPAGLQDKRKQMAARRNESCVLQQSNRPAYVWKGAFELQKKQRFLQNE